MITRPLAAGQSDQQTDDHRQAQRQAPVHQGDAEDRPGQSEHGTDRQIDAGDDQHERHTHGGNRRVGNLVGDGLKIRPGEEVLGGQSEDDQQQDQCGGHAEVLGQQAPDPRAPSFIGHVRLLLLVPWRTR
jgi:hypothetical protein